MPRTVSSRPYTVWTTRVSQVCFMAGLVQATCTCRTRYNFAYVRLSLPALVWFLIGLLPECCAHIPPPKLGHGASLVQSLSLSFCFFASPCM